MLELEVCLPPNPSEPSEVTALLRSTFTFTERLLLPFAEVLKLPVTARPPVIPVTVTATAIVTIRPAFLGREGATWEPGLFGMAPLQADP
jgi:hypothetical protein